MKFFHISDLHFGKILHDISLVEEDQRFWVSSLLKAVKEEKPDAVLIAGDIYDRRDPSTLALKLFDEMICGLVELDTKVFITPGNHDSAIRLAHMSPVLARNNVFIAGDLVSPKLLQYTLLGDCKVQITLMPYVFPKMVEDTRVLNRNDLDTYDEAVRALLNAQDYDKDAIQLLVAHQNVLANGQRPSHSESETVIGTVGEVKCDAFDGFDYVALGHIHNEQKIGRQTVRYCGCPLYYDFSEIGHKKGITIVEIHGKDDITVRMLEVPLLHTLRAFEGSIEKLLCDGRALTDEEKKSIYCMVTITDKVIPSHTVERLRDAFGDCLIHTERKKRDKGAQSDQNNSRKGTEKLSIEAQFEKFYQEQHDGEFLDDNKVKVIAKIIEQQEQYEKEDIQKREEILEKQTKELLDMLEGLLEEKDV